MTTLSMMMTRFALLVLLASAFSLNGTEGRASSSDEPSVLQVPGGGYFLLTHAPLRHEPVWGLDNIPVRARQRVHISRLDISQFDYSLPASYRRASSGIGSVRTDVTYGERYIEWVEAEVHKLYTRRFGEQIHVVLGSADQQYLFDAKQALLLHAVQKGLRKVSTTLNLEQTPFDDPVESVRLRALLEASFENLRQSPHPHDDTYPQVLRLALMRIKDQQKSEVMYQRFPSIFDANWNIVFPFLQEDRIDMVEYLLRSS